MEILSIEIANIITPNDFILYYKTGDYIGSLVDGFTRYPDEETIYSGCPSGCTVNVEFSGESINYCTQYWFKIEDIINHSFIIENKIINCKDYFSDICPEPIPSVTPSVTPSATPFATPSVTPSATPSVTPSMTPYPSSPIACEPPTNMTFECELVVTALPTPTPTPTPPSIQPVWVHWSVKGTGGNTFSIIGASENILMISSSNGVAQYGSFSTYDYPYTIVSEWTSGGNSEGRFRVCYEDIEIEEVYYTDIPSSVYTPHIEYVADPTPINAFVEFQGNGIPDPCPLY